MAEKTAPSDHVADDSDDDNGSEIEKHLKARPTWLRLVFMIVFYLLASVAGMVASVVVVLGFLWVLFTGEPNENLKRVGQGIAAYLAEIVEYLTYNTNVRPFPFDANWPAAQEPVDDNDE